MTRGAALLRRRALEGKQSKDYTALVMVTKRNQFDDPVDNQGYEIVKWGPKYMTKIKLIDSQHKALVSLTNELYRACLGGNVAAGPVFKESMSRMVEYVRFHFGAEQELLQKINYPHYPEHKKLHEDLVRSILKAAKEYNEGNKLAPNQFVRTLKDWVFSHIAVEDMIYSAYVMAQKKKGMLSELETEDQI